MYDLTRLAPAVAAQAAASPMFKKPVTQLLRTNGDAKTSKGEKLGIRTAILYLAPVDIAGFQACPMAGKAGCSEACLFTAGRGAMANVQLSRIRKSLFLEQYPEQFVAVLRRDLAKLVKQCQRDGVTPAVRLNGTSDIRWEAKPAVLALMAEFAALGVRFYDYTKIANRRPPSFYDLTYSYSGTASYQPYVKKAMANGMRLAVVFRTRQDVLDRIEAGATFKGLPIVDGDDTDVRFIEPQGVAVALYAKGQAKGDTSGFVVG